MMKTTDSSVYCQQWGNDAELRDPSPRKVTSNGDFIYQSHIFRHEPGWTAFGDLVLSDLGEARIGLEQEGLIQPEIYRSPEVVLGMKWGPQIDVWSVAVMVSVHIGIVVRFFYLIRSGMTCRHGIYSKRVTCLIGQVQLVNTLIHNI